MSVAAIQKAESLHKFASHSGYPIDTFALVISDKEAQDLLEWYAEQYEGTNDAFDTDLAVARLTRDPWPVLANFRVLGLDICKATLVLN